MALLERGTGDLLRQELDRGAAARLPAALWMGSYREVQPSLSEIISFGFLSLKS
uniref:Macaca fascicularis brain cDNA clone: QflA-23831, similar to human hypothetical protein AE2 (AE2), mRNA, RefSeq: NM_032264.1 n=1 Tax=Macaca fascicularis TaxID=9541 RepID=I7GMV8_MACFA|nr:unnamed protein product [Macaca fascicularis]